jgi:hypothetical protein
MRYFLFALVMLVMVGGVSASYLGKVYVIDNASNGTGLSVFQGDVPFTVNAPTDAYKNGLLTIFSPNITRQSFVERMNNTFSLVDNSGAVTYSCTDSGDVDVGLYGFKGLFSITTMVVIIVGGAMVWVFFKFVG